MYAIADNLSVHHGSLVREWAEKNADKIKLYYLPKYSPHLNPDEYLNSNLKTEMAKRGYSENADEVQEKATSILEYPHSSITERVFPAPVSPQI